MPSSVDRHNLTLHVPDRNMQHAICCTVHRQCLSSDTEMLVTLWWCKYSHGLLSASLSVSGSGNTADDCFHRTEATWKLFRKSLCVLGAGSRDYKEEIKQRDIGRKIWSHTHRHTHPCIHTQANKYLYTHINKGMYTSIYVCVCVCGCGWAGLLIRYSDWPQAGQFGNKFRCQRNFPPLHMWPGAFQPPVKWERFVSRGKVRQGRAANHLPHLVPRSWKSRGIFLPILLVTQDLNRFTLTLPIMYVNIYIFINISCWKTTHQ